MSDMNLARFPANGTRESLVLLQLERLNALLAVARTRPFYADRLKNVSLPLTSLRQLRDIPLLTKADLIPQSRPSPAAIFDLPLTQYTHMHQTSGTRGWPLPVLDTQADWQWWIRCWHYVLDAAEVTAEDIAMMAFSFGPFIGFWTANDAMIDRGALCVPLGGISSESRLKMIDDYGCTVLCCTPTYALHLVATAKSIGMDLTRNRVSRIIVAGEPGGSLPAVRRRIEEAWGAALVDHAGASELGAWGFGSADGRGLHVIESEFIAEVLDFGGDDPSGTEVAEGEMGELVLTNLGRFGGPAIRYRTGDIVRAYRDHDQPSSFVWLQGGVIGRGDDMIVIRGVNIFPSSIEAILRESNELAEYRINVEQIDEMDQLHIEIEGTSQQAAEIAQLLRDRIALRVQVTPVAIDSLPRFQAKSRRLVDQRTRQG
ncbi:Phenylacetate-coenzyme A ligase [Novipirellula galeiformis]|uniref:Phenylacetate-coenzyme A ligase n=1 Tax=Novipirellula galeiformis TaxID=2528004 RepID=A0A5C6CCJ9_9BACT|nr:phenylacetate--CoA ligase family protein [Novipirellula galeiformis]TWU22523.1 Phenylacetate-coenzyme A ligase [Novipirellula galeiformis]